MKLPGKMLGTRLLWIVPAFAIFMTGAVLLYPAVRANRVFAAQEKEEARSAGDQSTSLKDQTDLNVTVYNSNIALIRDVRNLTASRPARSA